MNSKLFYIHNFAILPAAFDTTDIGMSCRIVIRIITLGGRDPDRPWQETVLHTPGWER